MKLPVFVLAVLALSSAGLRADPFEADLSGLYDCRPPRYGPIDFVKGTCAWGPITVTERGWSAEHQQYMVAGTWSTPGKTGPKASGYFVFWFNSPTTFSGEWWYRDEDPSKGGNSWSGVKRKR